MPRGQLIASNATSLFDLYDFFSMFIPGTTLVVGLYPLLPSTISVNFYSVVLVTLLLGYVVGRGVHSAASSIDSLIGNKNHREVFAHMIQEDYGDDDLNRLVDRFYQQIREDIPIDNSPESRLELDGDLVPIIYVHARSKIEMKGKGRAQTFQATFAFYRSTHFVMLTLAAVYLAYSLAVMNGVEVSYPLYSMIISNLNIQPNILAAGAEILAGLSLGTFHDAKFDHRDYYVHYLLQEYLMISDSFDADSETVSNIAR